MARNTYNSIEPQVPVIRMPEASQSNTSSMAGSDKMSSVRRTFCLLVTFDVGLMFILWLIYTQLNSSDDVWEKFAVQVRNYTFKESLFDVVMLSAVRFTFLLLPYALYRLRHWLPVAFTTLMSCVFLIVKMFYFNFSGNAQNPLSYCLFIVSFVLAWVETFFMDFKVIPEELQEHQPRFTGITTYGSLIASDQQRLLRPDDVMSTATNDQYYSPVGTPEGSDVEDEEVQTTVGSRLNQNQVEDYHQKAQECWDKFWEYLTMPESEWKHEAGKSIQEGIVHSNHTRQSKKIFRLQGEVDIDPKSLWEELVHSINNAPSWNSTLLECNTVMVIDENTDISHNVANDALGGLVASRDFVNLRHWGIREGTYLSAGQGVIHPDCPPSKKRVRGVNGPGGWAFKPVPGEPNKCIFIWVMNTDLKGWIPQKLIDQASSSVLQDYLKDVQQRSKALKAEA